MTGRCSVVIFADLRFPGGTSAAVVAEIAALAQAGVVPGLCPVIGPLLKSPRTANPRLAALVEAGQARLLDPHEPLSAALVVIHHPSLFTHLPPEPLGIAAERAVLVLHHPPRDGTGAAQYDLPAIAANIAESFAAPVALAPVGPAVRAQIGPQDLGPAALLDEDWLNLLDFARWPLRPSRPSRTQTVIGRHSRPQLSKFPDTLAEALLCYPADPGVRIRILGAPPELARHYGALPPNWEAIPFGAEAVAGFLAGLDYYVYRHGSAWVEAFGYNLLEAIAAGVPVIAPPGFAPLFGPAALYAEPREVKPVIAALDSDPAAYAAHVRRARAEAETRFGLGQLPPRLDRTLPGWRDAPDARARPAPRPMRVAMVTSNGVGLGHLTRLMAVARALPETAEVSFFTLSQGYGLAAAAGYLTQFSPGHQYSGADMEAWNLALREELGAFLDLTRADIAVFDGNVPYPGLRAALAARPRIRRVWMRRALWATRNAAHVAHAGYFDLILEPGEISARFDTGATRDAADAIRLGPILLTPPEAQLPRAEARARVGLPETATCVGLMLGAGANYDLSHIRRAILAALARHPEVEVVEFVPDIAAGRPAPAETHRRMRLYPVAEYLQGFDLMVTGSGYNAFHECLLGAVPAIFVPNEAPEMDRQLLRADHARRIGCAELLRASDRARAAEVVARMLDPETRAAMRRRMQRLARPGGAAEAARLIGDLARALRMTDGLRGG